MYMFDMVYTAFSYGRALIVTSANFFMIGTFQGKESKPGTKNNLIVLKIEIVIKSGNKPLF